MSDGSEGKRSMCMMYPSPAKCNDFAKRTLPITFFFFVLLFLFPVIRALHARSSEGWKIILILELGTKKTERSEESQASAESK